MHLLIGGIAGARSVFMVCESWKILELLQMHTCLKPCAQMLFRHKRKNRNAVCLLLHCIGEYSCVSCCDEFVSSMGQVLGCFGFQN